MNTRESIEVLTALDSEYPRKNMPLGHVRALAEAALASAPQASQPPQGADIERLMGLAKEYAKAYYVAHSGKTWYNHQPLPVAEAALRAALAAPPQGASSLLPGWKLSLDESASELLRDTIGAEDHSPITLSLGDGADGPGLYVWLTEYPEEGAILLAASPLPAPQEPAGEVVMFGPIKEVSWRRGRMPEVGTKLYAAPAPVDPESQGAPYTQLMSDSVTVNPISATQPASPARELTDTELTAIGAKHLEAYAQFVGAGEVWVEGEVEFARAVIARDRALREQGR